MRDDLTKLYIKKQEQQENFFAEEAKFQEELKKELDGLIHSAFVEGYVPILLKDTSIFLLEGETLFWESPVKRNQRTSVSGAREWTFEIAGVLLLTNQRLIFASKLETWQHSLDEIEKIEVDDEYKGRMVAVYLNRRAVPVGFDVGPSEFTVTTEFSNHTIRANARDFVMVAKAVRAHEVSE